MNLNNLKDIVEIIQYTGLIVGATIAGVWTLVVYTKNSNLQKTQWLFSLFEKFYEHTTYKNIRRILDSGYEHKPEIRHLEKAIESEKVNDEKLLEQLIDYLNFFEFIAVLWKKNQLSIEEIQDLFDYYLKCLGRNSIIKKAITDWGFENLDKLLFRLLEKEGRMLKIKRPALLFVYGTLMKGALNEMHSVLAQNASYVGTARMRGDLFLVGEYPGAIPSANAKSLIKGELYAIKYPKIAFKILDEYEDYKPASKHESEFNRIQNQIENEQGETVKAWVYIYARPVEKLKRIPSGDFLKHIKTK